MSAFIPDQLDQMRRKELLEFAQTAHEENVKLKREVATVKRTYNQLFDEMLKEQERNRELAQQLAKANERVEELEEELLMLTLATGRQTVWDLGKKLLNKFALEQKKEELDELKSSLGCLDNRDASKFALAINKRVEQLRKEQENGLRY